MALLIPLVILIFRNIPFINHCDQEAIEEFDRQLKHTVVSENLHRAIAEKLSKTCYKLVMQCNADEYQRIQDGVLPRQKLCEYLELFSGPVGECFDYIRDELDQTELLSCVWNSSDEDYKRSIKDLGLTKPDDLTCESVLHPCTKPIIRRDCKPGVLEAIEQNLPLMEPTFCAGIRFYTHRDVCRYYLKHIYIRRDFNTSDLFMGV